MTQLGLAGRLATAVASLAILTLFGFVVGANYGGNHATDFEFAGVRGYEATGALGALLGMAAWTFAVLAVTFFAARKRMEGKRTARSAGPD